MQHRLKELDTDTRTAICLVCGPTKVRSAGKQYRCETVVREKIIRQESTRKQRDRTTRYPWRKAVEGRLRAGVCERCGFMAEDLCQLDVDHIIRRVDGGSNDPNNLQVLCANCHRLKTFKKTT